MSVKAFVSVWCFYAAMHRWLENRPVTRVKAGRSPECPRVKSGEAHGGRAPTARPSTWKTAMAFLRRRLVSINRIAKSTRIDHTTCENIEKM